MRPQLPVNISTVTETGLTQRIAYSLLSLVSALVLLSQSAAASHDTLDCEVPPDLVPLFELLDTLVELAFLLGVVLGALGLAVAGIFVMLPGQDSTRRGKDTAKYAIIGVIIVLSARGVIAFITSQLGSTICT